MSSRAGRAECSIRHSARQKTELKLELGQEFTLGEPSQAQYSIPVTSSSRARANENSKRAEVGQPLLARARLVYMPTHGRLSATCINTTRVTLSATCITVHMAQRTRVLLYTRPNVYLVTPGSNTLQTRGHLLATCTVSVHVAR
jgi:hypothetical protein